MFLSYLIRGEGGKPITTDTLAHQLFAVRVCSG